MVRPGALFRFQADVVFDLLERALRPPWFEMPIAARVPGSGRDRENPKEISYLSNLVSLDLSCYNCDIQLDQKTFEILLQNLTNLKVVSLSVVDISSPIPMNLSSSLRFVDLTDTNLQGVLTESFFLLPNLEMLKLGKNHLLKGVSAKIRPSSTLLELSIARTGISSELPYLIGTLSYLNRLDLYGCQFAGSIPDSIGNLMQIRQLDFGENNFTGHIPSTISKLKHLTLLDLRSYSLQGEIPDVFSNLRKLVRLFISNNSFTGPFPFSILSLRNLQSLDMSSNSLSGPLPSNERIFPKLCNLDLSHNSLNGTIPSWVSRFITHNHFSNLDPNCFSSKFEWLVQDFRRNNFTGSRPPLCGQSTSLSTIALNDNRFEGTVPMSFLNCDGLKILDLGNSALNDKFPAWLGNLEQLQVLILKSNKFHGPISTRQKFLFPRLRIFDISYNEFGGSLPTELFQNFRAMIKSDGMSRGQDIELQRITTIMTAIDLYGNHFEGVIPKVIADLDSLWLLNLSHNNLRGDIPKEMGQLNMLEALDISWNRLTGKIPQELARLTFLGKLNLSQNLLAGHIPQGQQFNTLEND
ncbi:hypothetical protein BC332_24215 [Capsicum chinense]|nr:hypothetical protein BC332_24215 [Capsicum chinense]